MRWPPCRSYTFEVAGAASLEKLTLTVGGLVTDGHKTFALQLTNLCDQVAVEWKFLHHRKRSGFTWAACVRLSQTEGQDTNNGALLLSLREQDVPETPSPPSALILFHPLRPEERVGGDGGGAFSRVFFHTYTVTHHESSKKQ